MNQDYKYTTIYKDIGDFIPSPDSLYIYSYSTEDRSRAVDELIEKNDTVHFLFIDSADNDEIMDSRSNKYSLRRSDEIIKLISAYRTSGVIYIDVTGIGNRISAPLINSIINELPYVDMRIVYAEPAQYKIKQFKAEGVFNDLSEAIGGINPIPGFASIIPDCGDEYFIALLGFEGGRFSYLLENSEVSKDNIYPIIGVPGYRPEYPFVAYWGNRRPLDSTGSWRNARYVAANSLVDAFILLTKLRKEFGGKKIKIAPIGTKPHAIAAILFAIKYKESVEVVYDNPKRKNKRTKGVGLIVETHISQLLKDN